MAAMLPMRRAKGLVVEALTDETIVYDTTRHKAHCLNPVASLVWTRCDGRSTVESLASALHDEMGVPADEDLVRLTLRELGRRWLLEEDFPDTTAQEVPRKRRCLTRRMALYGISTALVATIGSPTPAAAASCVGAGGICFQNFVYTPCCKGLTCSQIQGGAIRCR